MTMTRRALLAAPLVLRGAAGGLAERVRTLPNYCSHEHWGSIESIGRFEGGYRADRERGALPTRPTTLADLTGEPYLSGWIRSGGGDEAEHHGTGGYQCTRRGIEKLYGVDIARSKNGLDARIARNYANLFGWYREAMRQAGFSRVQRIVHPEYYWGAPVEAESELGGTLLRVDPLLELWRPGSARRQSLGQLAGVEPVDAASWRRFLTVLFDKAAAGGAVGSKQLQAYRRNLRFVARGDGEVKRWVGDLDGAEQRVFEDWVMHACAEQAHERGWPHQVHTGTHNMPDSSPVGLEILAHRYPRMKVVMIHCWPFFSEAGALAKRFANCYLDTCWLPVLSPQFFRQAMEEWGHYVPRHKITCSHDATTVEMAVGSSLYTREILAEVGEAQRRVTGESEEQMARVLGQYLAGNAERLYSR